MKNIVTYRIIDLEYDFFTKTVDLNIDIDTGKIVSVLTVYNDKFKLVTSSDEKVLWTYLQEIIINAFNETINYDGLEEVLNEEEYNKLKSLDKEDVVLKRKL